MITDVAPIEAADLDAAREAIAAEIQRAADTTALRRGLDDALRTGARRRSI
jgi:hypothetical protein